MMPSSLSSLLPGDCRSRKRNVTDSAFIILTIFTGIEDIERIRFFVVIVLDEFNIVAIDIRILECVLIDGKFIIVCDRLRELSQDIRIVCVNGG